jgi:hypothetical protein
MQLFLNRPRGTNKPGDIIEVSHVGFARELIRRGIAQAFAAESTDAPPVENNDPAPPSRSSGGTSQYRRRRG